MTIRSADEPDEHQADPPCEMEALQEAPPLTGRANVALFLDVDGTLLDIAERPDAVSTPNGLVRALERAARKLSGALALVSGRPIDELDRLFAPLRLPASGVHGAQMRFNADEAPQPTPRARALPDGLLAAAANAFAAMPGVVVEPKRYSLAAHYRAAPAAGPQVRAILQALIDREGHGDIELLEAHFAFEAKMSGFDKGAAIGTFLDAPPFAGRTPIFIGDDATDEAGFATVAARGGRAFSVGERRPHASGVFADPKAVRAWLAAFAS